MAITIKTVPLIVQAFIIFSFFSNPVTRAICAKMHANGGLRKKAIDPMYALVAAIPL
jgi:hypothetical protein